MIFHLFIIFFLLLSLLTPQTTLAQKTRTGKLTVVPAFLEVSLEGAKKERPFEITYENHTNKPVTLEFSAIDFKQEINGKISFFQDSSAGSYSYSLASFLEFKNKTLELLPGESRAAWFVAINRENLSPGGHYAAIIAKVVMPEKNDTTIVTPSLSTLILLRKVGGEHFNLSLVSADWPQGDLKISYPPIIDLLFQNEGNIHLVPYGRIDITDMFGRLLYKGIINTSSLYIFPESRRHIPVSLRVVERSFPVSFNTVVIRGQDSLRKTNYFLRESYLFIDPRIWGAAIIVVIFIYLWKRKKS